MGKKRASRFFILSCIDCSKECMHELNEAVTKAISQLPYDYQFLLIDNRVETITVDELETTLEDMLRQLKGAGEKILRDLRAQDFNIPLPGVFDAPKKEPKKK